MSDVQYCTASLVVHNVILFLNDDLFLDVYESEVAFQIKFYLSIHCMLSAVWTFLILNLV